MSVGKYVPAFKPPSDPDVKIWRYMDFTKYVSMLKSGALFFSRADLLGDPFEGSYSKANAPHRERGPIPERSLAELSEFYERLRRWTFVNCWHMNDHESAAMWTIYSRSDRAIALQSTYRRLEAAMKPHEHVYVGTVSYVDYENQPIPEGNSFYPYLYKRHSYEHEREIRAVIQELPHSDSGGLDWTANPSSGIEKRVEVEDLVESVHVSPGSPEWYMDVTTAVTEKFGITTRVLRSALDEDPFF